MKRSRSSSEDKYLVFYEPNKTDNKLEYPKATVHYVIMKVNNRNIEFFNRIRTISRILLGKNHKKVTQDSYGYVRVLDGEYSEIEIMMIDTIAKTTMRSDDVYGDDQTIFFGKYDVAESEKKENTGESLPHKRLFSMDIGNDTDNLKREYGDVMCQWMYHDWNKFFKN